ncbi:MAG: hypothetical protein CL916_02810 [Deltaproteobacteria bacterium]|nr:hypothetical protein [Deltaproteobacteria bacterium]
MTSNPTENITKSLPFGQSILSLNQQSPTSYSGAPFDLGWKRLYGGHLIAQSLLSSHLSSYVKGSLSSFHACFLHIGNCRHTLNYSVAPLRIGRESSRVQVQAKQNNRFLFQIMASYTDTSSQQHGHNPQFPSVIEPEELENDHEMLHTLLRDFPHSTGLKSFVQRRINTDTGLDIKPIFPNNFLHSEEKSTKRQLWFRMRSHIPQDLASLLLAYTSDFLLVGTSLQSHSLSILSPSVKFVSLDHSMWFYNETPQNEWILMDAKSEVYTKGRSLVQGDFYTRNGIHIASCKQEGFFHIRDRVHT